MFPSAMEILVPPRRMPGFPALSTTLLLGLVAGATFPAPARAQTTPAVSPAHYAGMTYRMVGPHRGGRVEAVAGVPGEPHTFYMGGTGGGVWKTDDAGAHWTPIADEFLTAGSIGALAVASSRPAVLYAGTGSACIRGNVSIGRGLWKSMDGGERWQFIGLPLSGAVGDLVVHPADHDRVYVAALGNPFAPNPERGVYRTRDGGATWDHVLFLNDSTGAVSLAMNPANPDEVFAGMWRAERKPWTLISGGADGGVYRTRDGGDTWTKLGGGLPEGVVGRVGLSISASNPRRVWAMVEAEPGNGLYRSDDGGESWTFLTNDSRLTGRAWYYHHVVADPTDDNTVYVLNVRLYRSTDGGRTFDLIPVPHGDVHDLWVNPHDPDIFVVGDDGGAVVTLNHGRTFSTMYNQPTAELYDVVVDNQEPYRVYGSQQDNTAISVPSRPGENALRPQEEWRYAAGCETGPVALHPDHPDIVWGGCYSGVINRMDVARDLRRNMNLYPANQNDAPRDLRYRFQWVAPIVVSPHDPETVYHASQYVHRTRDGGWTWETLSPDLTTNTPEHQGFPGEPLHGDHSGVEIFNTVFALVVSPHDAETLWVGTDDGLVHLSRDDGATWNEITPAGMPRWATVNRIEVSPHRAGRAFLAVQRYRMGDPRPYVFRTDDFGESWTLLTDGANGIPADHWVRVVREDDTRQGLLYAGTEFGVFVSFDDGRRWQRLQENLPASPVTDMKVHRGDLVLSTQGRSFWILDDLTPLRELAAEPLADDRPVRLFTPRDAARGFSAPPLQEVDLIRPDDLPDGALVHYTVSGEVTGLELEILDAEDRVVTSWRAGAGGGGSLSDTPGLHRRVWPLRYAEGGVKAPPGTYRARLRWNGGSETRSFRVLTNPRDPFTAQADYDEQYRVTVEVRDSLEAVRDALARVRSARSQADAIVLRVREAGREAGALPDLGRSLDARLATLEAELTSTERAEPPLYTLPGLDRQYQTLFGNLNGGGGYGPGAVDGRPTAGAMERKADLDRLWSALRARVEVALDEEVAAFNAEVVRLGLEAIVLR
jgi:photosystem II stability/assembly factor-like uncharacterized protein